MAALLVKFIEFLVDESVSGRLWRSWHPWRNDTWSRCGRRCLPMRSRGWWRLRPTTRPEVVLRVFCGPIIVDCFQKMLDWPASALRSEVRDNYIRMDYLSKWMIRFMFSLVPSEITQPMNHFFLISCFHRELRYTAWSESERKNLLVN